MPRVSHEELLVRLTKGKPIPALLLLGDEPFLRDASRAQLIETFVPEAARPWAVSRYSADRNETQDALEQAQTLPMLAPRAGSVRFVISRKQFSDRRPPRRQHERP